MRNTVTTSVVIITRNRAKSLINCLRSIEKQSVLPSEVIVVDNASSDGTKKVAEKFTKTLNIRYLYQPIVSIPISRNAGLEKAKGEIILSLDDDCIASKNWVKNVIKAHQKYPKAVAIQGNTKSIPKDKIYSIILQHHRDFRIKRSKLNSGGLLYLSANNCSFKAELLKKYHLKIHQILRYIGDDTDLAGQIVTKGGLILFDRTVVAYHKERENLADFLRQRYRQGVVPYAMRKRWPNLKFHFYHSTLLAHLLTFVKICKELIRLKKYMELIALPFILMMAILAFESAVFEAKFNGKLD